MKWVLIPITWLFSKDGQLSDLPSWLVLLILLTIAFSIFCWYCLQNDIAGEKRIIEANKIKSEREKKNKLIEFEKGKLLREKERIKDGKLFNQLPCDDSQKRKIVKNILRECNINKVEIGMHELGPNFHYHYLHEYSKKKRHDYEDKILKGVLSIDPKFPISKKSVKIKLDFILDDCVQIGVEELALMLKINLELEPNMEKSDIAKTTKWEDVS